MFHLHLTEVNKLEHSPGSCISEESPCDLIVDYSTCMLPLESWRHAKWFD